MGFLEEFELKDRSELDRTRALSADNRMSCICFFNRCIGTYTREIAYERGKAGKGQRRLGTGRYFFTDCLEGDRTT